MRLETLNAAAVIAKIDAEILRRRAIGEPVILATDADGTLWAGDVGIDTFEALLAKKAVRDAARGMLAAEARALDVDATGDANELARRLYDVYLADRYPLDRAFAMMARAWAGFSEDEITEVVAEVLHEKKLGERVHRPMLDIVAWAHAAGVDVWVVSASPLHAVRVGVAHFEIERARVVAMAPSMHLGRLGDSIDGPLVYGPGKIAALHRHLPDAKIAAAFGDSAFDAAMLREATIPILVGPSKALLDEAATIPNAALLDLG